MTVFDSTIAAAAGLGYFFKNLGEKRLNAAKKMAKEVLKNPGRDLEIGANVGTAFASTSSKVVSSTLLEMIVFIIQEKG